MIVPLLSLEGLSATENGMGAAAVVVAVELGCVGVAAVLHDDELLLVDWNKKPCGCPGHAVVGNGLGAFESNGGLLALKSPRPTMPESSKTAALSFDSSVGGIVWPFGRDDSHVAHWTMSFSFSVQHTMKCQD
jgi:hypothetical protein